MAENGGAAKSSLAAAGNHVDNAEVNGGSTATAANMVRFTVQVATLYTAY